MSDVRDFGAVGDGKTDDTDAIQHAIDEGIGRVEFPRGDFLITRTLLVDLEKTGRTGIDGSGGSAIAMKADAVRIVSRDGGIKLVSGGTSKNAAGKDIKGISDNSKFIKF